MREYLLTHAAISTITMCILWQLNVLAEVPTAAKSLVPAVPWVQAVCSRAEAGRAQCACTAVGLLSPVGSKMCRNICKSKEHPLWRVLLT